MANTQRFYVQLDNSRYICINGERWTSLKSLAKRFTNREADDYIRDFSPMYGAKNLKKIEVEA